MNFFQAQDQARKRTTLLVTLYCLVILVLTGVLYALGLIAWYNVGHAGAPGGAGMLLPPPQAWFVPELLLGVGGFVGLVLGGASLVKVLQLRQGGSSIALSLGAVPLERVGIKDVRYLQLKNVVEEMTIASGCPHPEVFVLDEDSINAFAAGWVPENAAIAVTRGALNYLTRDELQGVVAHEFSHIAHGDMRLNCRMLALITGLFAFAAIGRVLMEVAVFSGSRYPYRTLGARRRRSGGEWRLAVFFIGLALWIIGWIGVVAGWIIQAAVSRQREYLADASAVQYTRNPEGIAGALKKIGGLSLHGRIRNPRAAELAHLFFADIHRSLLGLLATHPPLVERIRRLDPSFDGTFPEVRPVTVVEPEPLRRAAAVTAQGIRTRWQEQAVQGLDAEYELDAEAVYQSVGNPNEKDLQYARGLKAAWPVELVEAVRDPYTARAVIYALLLDPDPQIRQRQLRLLETHAAAGLAQETRQIAQLLDDVGRESWLPLAQLAVAALGMLSAREFAQFKANLSRLVLADSKLSLFEYCLTQAVLAPLEPKYEPRRRAARVRVVPRAAVPQIAIVIGTLAHLGHRSPAQAAEAYSDAIRRTLPAGWIRGHEHLPDRPQCSLREFDRALKRLRHGTLRTRELTLQAALRCVAYDGRITIPEAEAVRAIASVLRLAVPPIVNRIGRLKTPSVGQMQPGARHSG